MSPSPTSEVKYTLWLLPQAAQETQLNTSIQQLATRFDAPFFGAHATLLPGLRGDPAELINQVKDLIFTWPSFQAPVKQVAMTTAFFRALFLEMEPIDSFFTYRKEVVKVLQLEPKDHFRPHVSLLYAELAKEEKEAGLEMVRRELPKQVLFDRVSLVRTSGPVETWETVEVFALFKSGA